MRLEDVNTAYQITFLMAVTSEGLRLLSYLCFFELPSTLISQIYLGSNY
jgi:hypothetical protein